MWNIRKHASPNTVKDLKALPASVESFARYFDINTGLDAFITAHLIKNSLFTDYKEV